MPVCDTSLDFCVSSLNALRPGYWRDSVSMESIYDPFPVQPKRLLPLSSAPNLQLCLVTVSVALWLGGRGGADWLVSSPSQYYQGGE